MPHSSKAHNLGLSDFNPNVQYNEFSTTNASLSDLRDPLLLSRHNPEPQRSQEEMNQRLTKPSVLASILCGLLMLMATLAFQSSRYLNAHNNELPHNLHYPNNSMANNVMGWGLFFTKTAFAHLILLIIILPFSLIDCSKPFSKKHQEQAQYQAQSLDGSTSTRRPPFSSLHVFFALIAPVLLVGLETLAIYTYSLLSHTTNFNGAVISISFQWNMFALFLSANILLLSAYCLAWYPERPVSPWSGVLSEIFVFLAVAALLLVSWDTRVPWDWEQWGPAYWNYYISYTGVTLLWGGVILAYRVCLATKMPFTHVTAFVLGFGFIVSCVPAVIFEVLPNPNDYYIQFVSLFQGNPYVNNYELVDVGVIVCFMVALIGLSRFSDALTTGFAVALSWLVMVIEPTVETVIYKAMRFGAGEYYIFAEAHRVFTAGVAATVLVLFYFFFRVLTMTCLYGFWAKKLKTEWKNTAERNTYLAI